MKRYWVLAGVTLLAAGLAVGVALAAMGPRGAGGPGGQGPGMATEGQGQGGPQRRPKGPEALVKHLEEAMGKSMTDDQKKQVGEAGKTLHEAMKAAHETFIKKLAAITGLSVEKVREALPPPPPQGGKQPPAKEGNQPPPPPDAPSE